MNSVMLKIRRGEIPFYRRLRDAARRIVSSTLPVPRFLNPLLRFGFNAQLMFMSGIALDVAIKGGAWIRRGPYFAPSPGSPTDPVTRCRT